MAIDFMVKQHWPEIDSEFCFAEAGNVVRTGGKVIYAGVETSEKIPLSSGSSHEVRQVTVRCRCDQTRLFTCRKP